MKEAQRPSAVSWDALDVFPIYFWMFASVRFLFVSNHTLTCSHVLGYQKNQVLSLAQDSPACGGPLEVALYFLVAGRCLTGEFCQGTGHFRCSRSKASAGHPNPSSKGLSVLQLQTWLVLLCGRLQNACGLLPAPGFCLEQSDN